MLLHYQMELGLGRRRGRVVRRFGGPRAWILGLIDLALGLVFGLIGLTLRLVALALQFSWRLAVGCLTMAVALLLLPLRLARRLGCRRRTRSPAPIGRPVKSAWSALDEF